MAACQIHKKYPWLKCPREAMPDDPDGLCLLHSRQEDKNKDGAFTAAVKAKLAQEDYDFPGVFFPGPFSISKLTGQEKFTFAKPANFFWAIFQGKADFSDATFQEAYFSDAIFQKAAHLSGATFQEAGFSMTTFQESAHFSGATFSGPAIFDSLNPPDDQGWRPALQADFSSLTLPVPGALRFQDLSLAQVEFAGTDLRKCEFAHVNWHPHRGRQALYGEVLIYEKEVAWVSHRLKTSWLSWREKYRLCCSIKAYFSLFREARLGARLLATNLYCRSLFLEDSEEEQEPPESEEYDRAEECYRGLKLNCEAAGDFKNADDFHYGEMEMHRRASPWRRFNPFSFYNLYRVLSGYGERPRLAAAWLAGFFLLTAACFCLTALPSPSGPAPNLWSSLLYIFQKATWQRPDMPWPVYAWGHFISSLSPLLIPGQAALFLLALRNRLGRRR
jgi:uncharacterized protein YjbI with pentapeptide repeats